MDFPNHFIASFRLYRAMLLGSRSGSKGKFGRRLANESHVTLPLIVALTPSLDNHR